MGKDPAFLFYPGDYFRDTQCLSEKSQVAYDRIMCEHMRSAEDAYEKHMPITRDSIKIAKHVHKFLTKGLNEEELEQLSNVIVKLLDGFQIEWVVTSIINRISYRESRKHNGGGKGKSIQEAYAPRIVNENEDTNIDTVNGYTDTNITNSNINKCNKEQIKVTRVKKVETTLPQDFEITEKMRNWAVQKGITQIEERTEYFKNSCISKNRKYTDWEHAWRNGMQWDIPQGALNGKTKSNTSDGTPKGFEGIRDYAESQGIEYPDLFKRADNS